MLTAKPLDAFRLGERQIVTCRVPGGNAFAFIDKECWFYGEATPGKKIRIEGISTASVGPGEVFDFLYTGPEIQRSDLDDASLITNGIYEDAKRFLEVA